MTAKRKPDANQTQADATANDHDERVRVHLTLPRVLLALVDRCAEEDERTRSVWMTRALRTAAQQQLAIGRASAASPSAPGTPAVGLGDRWEPARVRHAKSSAADDISWDEYATAGEKA